MWAILSPHLLHVINVQKCGALKPRKRNARAIYIQDWYGIICAFRKRNFSLCQYSFLSASDCMFHATITN
jgi:hypothetical protein